MVELIWDAGRHATCTAGASGLLTLDEGSWSTDDLLAGAVALDLMRTFLDLAADIAVLGYVASADVTAPADPPRLSVRLVVTVARGTSADVVRVLCEQATERAPLARLLAAPPHVSCDVEVLLHGPH